ncbi:MAG: hypothetical protein WBA90_14790 [Albidovulum sp.]
MRIWTHSRWRQTILTEGLHQLEALKALGGATSPMGRSTWEVVRYRDEAAFC